MSMTVISALKWWARERPQSNALVIKEDSLSFAALDAWAEAIAVHLAETGVRVGDRVAIYANNSLAYCAAIIGIVRSGAIFVPINNRYTPREVGNLADKTTPCLVLTDADNAKQLRDSGIDAAIVRDLEEIWDLRSVRGVVSSTQIDSDMPIVIMPTSGSTGAPKGVVHTHFSMLSAAHQLRVQEIGFDPGNTSLTLMPIYTGGALVHLFQLLALGQTNIFEVKFDPEQALRILQAKRVSSFM